jgi:hypothetical protein
MLISVLLHAALVVLLLLLTPPPASFPREPSRERIQLAPVPTPSKGGDDSVMPPRRQMLPRYAALGSGKFQLIAGDRPRFVKSTRG